MRNIEVTIYDFKELSNDAQEKALNNYRNTDIDVSLAIDDYALFEPNNDEMVKLFGDKYEFPLIGNTRKNVYFDTDRDSYLDCHQAIKINNNTQFLNWLGITDINLLNNLSYNIHTPSVRDSSTTIDLTIDYNYELTEKESEILENAEDKFNEHIQDVLIRIKSNIEYMNSYKAIIEDFECNGYEFYEDGRIA